MPKKSVTQILPNLSVPRFQLASFYSSSSWACKAVFSLQLRFQSNNRCTCNIYISLNVPAFIFIHIPSFLLCNCSVSVPISSVSNKAFWKTPTPPICISTTIIFIKRWHWTRRCWNSQPSVSAFIRCYRPPSQSRLLLIFPGHIRPHSRWRITRPFLLYLYLCICVFARSLLNGSIFYFWQGVIRYTRTRNPLNNGTPKILSTDVLTHNCSCFEFSPLTQLEQKYFELNDMMLTERCPVLLFD